MAETVEKRMELIGGIGLFIVDLPSFEMTIQSYDARIANQMIIRPWSATELGNGAPDTNGKEENGKDARR